MSNPISAGSGPAALVLVGGFLLAIGNGLGWLVMAGGAALSVLWALR